MFNGPDQPNKTIQPKHDAGNLYSSQDQPRRRILDGSHVEYAYDELSDKDHKYLYIQTLYDAYVLVCQDKSLPALSFDMICHMLLHIPLTSYSFVPTNIISPIIKDARGNIIIQQNPYISRASFEYIQFVGDLYLKYRDINKSLISPPETSSLVICGTNIPWVILLLHVVECVLMGYILYTKMNLPYYLIMAKSGAVMILFNMMIILFDVSNILHSMDHEFVRRVIVSDTSIIHKLCAYEIFIGTIIHITGHILHLFDVLHKCSNGCTYEQVYVIPKSILHGDTPIEISWYYFLKQPAYYYGIFITVVMLLLILGVVCSSFKKIRISSFYLSHQILAILFCLGMVLHGIDQLLGFNLSYILVLPFLIKYLYMRRYEFIFPFISKWSETSLLYVSDWNANSNMIRICFEPNDRLSKQLDTGVIIAVYIKQKNISSWEWHPFTVYKGPDNRSYMAIRSSGVWTKKLIKQIMNSYHARDNTIWDRGYVSLLLGHTSLSSFRFYRHYKNKLFFCSGIGITPFLTILSDPFEIDRDNTLIWSVNSPELLREFIPMINSMKVDAIIFYSNSSSKGPNYKPIQPLELKRFSFLQALIHHYSGVDIAHGLKSPVIILMERANVFSIVSRSVSSLIAANMNSREELKIGIFTCGSSGYMKNVSDNVNKCKGISKVQLELWSELL